MAHLQEKGKLSIAILKKNVKDFVVVNLVYVGMKACHQAPIATV